ncbi:hypothetical protein CKAH01_06883 [Colletotrichum kahawae]|uniref:Uncharacterized protein n=1 Tax=Colletotrichum kahawae TaxID=34407 RepID=A0AAD9Y6T9_COLKA|nr:hypothetical protein CKAH01_06883 [Colletotrichum kahawae]
MMVVSSFPFHDAGDNGRLRPRVWWRATRRSASRNAFPWFNCRHLVRRLADLYGDENPQSMQPFSQDTKPAVPFSFLLTVLPSTVRVFWAHCPLRGGEGGDFFVLNYVDWTRSLADACCLHCLEGVRLLVFCKWCICDIIEEGFPLPLD